MKTKWLKMNCGLWVRIWWREEGFAPQIANGMNGESGGKFLTEEVAEGEVLAGGPIFVVDFGVFEEVVPAERVADGVVFVAMDR